MESVDSGKKEDGNAMQLPLVMSRFDSVSDFECFCQGYPISLISTDINVCSLRTKRDNQQIKQHQHCFHTLEYNAETKACEKFKVSSAD